MRIVRARYKLSFIAGAWAITYILSRVSSQSLTSLWIWSIVGPFLTFALYVYGSRVFRGEGESLAPRPWWRWTAKPTASRVLGVLFVCAAAFMLVVTILDLTVPAISRFYVGSIQTTGFLGVLMYVALAFFYLNSWARLRRSATEVRPLGTPEEAEGSVGL